MAEDNRFLRAYAEHKREKEQMRNDAQNSANRFASLKDTNQRYQESAPSRFDCLRSNNYTRGEAFVRQRHYVEPRSTRPTPLQLPQLKKKKEEPRVPMPVPDYKLAEKKPLPESTIILQNTSLHEYTCLSFKNGKFIQEQVSENNEIAFVKPTYSSWADVVKTKYIFDAPQEKT